MAEPSLRSSRPPATSCKLARTDQSLHETTQRFVESLSKDIRISQYADPAYAAKRLSDGERWQWLEPIGRQGYLVFLPKQPIVWIDDQCKKSFKIPLRVSASLYEKKSVFLASLNSGDGELRIEDCWLLRGKLQRQLPFSQRWDSVLEFFTSLFREDAYLQRGLRITSASFLPLTAALSWKDILPPFMIAQGEIAPRRLRVQLQSSPEPPSAPEAPSASTIPTHAPAAVSVQEEPEGFARAIPHPEYPDTYDLFVGSVKKGYAAVQDLRLSRKLREASAAAESGVRVKVEWNEEFKMLEIVSVAESSHP